MEQLLKYKETEFGKIPEEWNIVYFQEFVDKIQSGIWGEDAIDEKNAYPILRSTDISHESKIIYETAAIRKIPLEKISDYKLNNGDILIVSSSGSPHLIGRSAIFMKPDNRTYLFSNFLIRITPSKSIVAEYLYYLLHSHYYYSALHKIQETTSGLRNLSKSQLSKMSLPVASLGEQHKIASILSNIDELMQKTDQIIAKTQRLKKGVIHRLLNKGIGHTKFKKVKTTFGSLVELPEDWEIVNLGQMIKDIRYGTSIKCSSTPEGIPVLRIPNIVQGVVNFDDLKYAVLSQDEVKRFGLKHGDILFVRTNGNREYVGRCAVFHETNGDYGFASYLIRVKLNVERLTPDFFALQLSLPAMKKQIMNQTKTSAGQYNINTEGINSLEIIFRLKEFFTFISTFNEKTMAHASRL